MRRGLRPAGPRDPAGDGAATRAATGWPRSDATWQRQLDGVGSVATHAFQVWLRPDERSLGWAHPGTTMSAFAKPFDTWASMSHLVDAEDWGAVEPPATVGYFCSTLPTTGRRAGADAAGRTRAAGHRLPRAARRHFWPNAVDPATGRLPLGLLCADADARRARRASTASTGPPTSSPPTGTCRRLPGTDAYRLRPDAERLRQPGPGRRLDRLRHQRRLHRGGRGQRAAGGQRAARPFALGPDQRAVPSLAGELDLALLGVGGEEGRAGGRPPPRPRCGPARRRDRGA